MGLQTNKLTWPRLNVFDNIHFSNVPDSLIHAASLNVSPTIDTFQMFCLDFK